MNDPEKTKEELQKELLKKITIASEYIQKRNVFGN